jgi:hypothetical protein
MQSAMNFFHSEIFPEQPETQQAQRKKHEALAAVEPVMVAKKDEMPQAANSITMRPLSQPKPTILSTAFFLEYTIEKAAMMPQ